MEGRRPLASFSIAITGASGVVYGLALTGEILKRGDDVELVISPSGFLILVEEAGLKVDNKETGDPEVTAKAVAKWLEEDGRGPLKGKLTCHSHDDMCAPMASGSALKRTMVICPASMGTLSRVATGASTNLVERAADCVIKEGGLLVVVPRETPLSAIHLENMLKLARLDVAIVPAMPGFYPRPGTIRDMVDFVVGKVLDRLGIENNLYKRWEGR